jgi:hypothetical protein
VTASIHADLKPLPVPPNYMRSAERKQIREMTAPMARLAGDHRSADRIIEQSLVASRFLNSHAHVPLVDELMMQVGDWTEANPDPQSRADAAYNLDKVLRFIDNLDDRVLNGSLGRNGKIDGLFNAGYTLQDNSEASVLMEFARKGYSVLRYLPA